MSTAIPVDADQAIARLRQWTGEEDLDTSTFERDHMIEILGRHTDLEGAAAEVWSQKASRFSNLVNVSEGGSKRDLGALAKQAREQVAFWEERTNEIVVVAGAARTQTRPIERP